jgi:uncharacterized damage-inducible protein DinB
MIPAAQSRHDVSHIVASMNTREFFMKQFASEAPKFANVIRALPTDKLDYKPHERSSSAGAIAWFLVLSTRALADLVKTGENRWSQPPSPGTTETVAAEYDKAAKDLSAALTSVDDAQWEKNARMLVGDKVMMEKPLGDIVLNFFLDAVHHRGQLTTYLRPMGGTVPSVYGPTADSK